MTFPKDPSKYPKAFFSIFEQAKLSKRLEFDCGDEKSAIRTRQQLHGFRRALERVGYSLDLRTISISITGSKIILTDNEEFLSRISGAQPTNSPPPEISEEEMNRYLEQLDKELPQ